MPNYAIKDIPQDLWAKFTSRANADQWPLRALFLKLIEDYGSGRIERLSGAPPEQMPIFAWMRPYYRTLRRRDPTFHQLDAQIQWERLVTHIEIERPGRAADLPIERKRQVLNWLFETSQDLTPGPNRLSLRAIAHSGEGPRLDINRRVIQYEVLGLPPGQQALIAYFQRPSMGWRIMRIKEGQQEPYRGHYLEAEEALRALEAEIYIEQDLTGDTEHS